MDINNLQENKYSKKQIKFKNYFRNLKICKKRPLLFGTNLLRKYKKKLINFQIKLKNKVNKIHKMQ
jgi:hypothetical protein